MIITYNHTTAQDIEAFALEISRGLKLIPFHAMERARNVFKEINQKGLPNLAHDKYIKPQPGAQVQIKLLKADGKERLEWEIMS